MIQTNIPGCGNPGEHLFCLHNERNQMNSNKKKTVFIVVLKSCGLLGSYMLKKHIAGANIMMVINNYKL